MSTQQAQPLAGIGASDARTIADLAASSQDPRHVGDGFPALILPHGTGVHLLERTLLGPLRKRGTVSVNDEASFIHVVNEQRENGDPTHGTTHLYSITNPPSFTAVFNDTGLSEAGWGDHRAEYKVPLSPEWKTWTGQHDQKVGQVDMAQFIENNLDDVIEPAGAELLEVARTLQAKKSVEFKSGIRLSDGSNELTFNEEVKGAAGVAGKLAIPEQFVLGIPVFENGELWRVPVRLRYRLNGAQLVMWIEIVRPHKIIEKAINEMRVRISDLTQLKIINGTATPLTEIR